MSRTDQFTPAYIIAALESTGAILSAAALKLGISRQALSGYVKRYPEIEAARLEIRESMCDLAELKLISLVKAGNLTAVIFYLKTQAKDRGYIESREVTGKGGAPIEVASRTIDVGKLTFDQQKALLAAVVSDDETDEG